MQTFTVPSHMHVVHHKAALARIHAPGVNAVVLPRQPAPGINAYLQAMLAQQEGFMARARLTRAQLDTSFNVAMDYMLAKWSALAADRSPMKQVFYNLLQSQARIFLALSGKDVVDVEVHLGLRGGIADTFHADNYGLLVNSVLRGPGTEWLPNHAVSGVPMRYGVQIIGADETLAQRIPTGWLVAQKGGRNGLVHRRPVFHSPRLFVTCLDRKSADVRADVHD